MILRLASYTPSYRNYKLITLTLYRNSYEQYKKDILISQFHLNGHRHFQKSKVLARTMDSNTVQIEKMQISLQKKRRVLEQLKQKKVLWDEQQFLQTPQCIEYLQSYTKLLQYMQLSNLKQDWHLRIAGWFNMQPFIRTMIDRMVIEQGKNQHLALLQSINWMQPHRLTLEEDDLLTMKKEEKTIDNYYRKLNLTHSIKVLKLVEGILEAITTKQKGKYYERYVSLQLKNLIKTTNLLNLEQVDNLLWLFQIYVLSFNDNPIHIKQFQQNIILSLKMKLQQSQIDKLLSIYNHMGRLNPQIYRNIIKPNLLSQTHNNFMISINLLQFMISSQIFDSQIIIECLKQIVIASKKNIIPDVFRLKIHFSLQYLRIKAIPFQFSPSLDRQYSDLCRRYKGNGTLARSIATQLDEKGRREGKEYYISTCLKKGRARTENTVEDKGLQIAKVPGYSRYKNVRFCCINLSQCVMNDQTKETVILQPRYHKFSYSGRVSRFQEIQNQILTYYGFKINYLEPKIDIQERTMQKLN